MAVGGGTTDEQGQWKELQRRVNASCQQSVNKKMSPDNVRCGGGETMLTVGRATTDKFGQPMCGNGRGETTPVINNHLTKRWWRTM
jgi:hypothetical protein